MDYRLDSYLYQQQKEIDNNWKFDSFLPSESVVTWLGLSQRDCLLFMQTVNAYVSRGLSYYVIYWMQCSASSDVIIARTSDRTDQSCVT